MKRILTIAVAATTLVGLGACSSDSKSSVSPTTAPTAVTVPDVSIPDLSIPDISMPDFSIPDISIPTDLSLPADLSKECMAVATQFAQVMAVVFLPADQQPDLDKVFGDLSSSVPEELRPDVTVMATAFAEFSTVLKANGNDMSNPEVQAALESIGTPEVQAASDRIQAYFDATCPQG
ncbi:MAG: hypothetical protein WCC60_06670 [Ilumatobacteraceae bacterium]